MPRYVRDEERIARAIDRTRRGLADVQRPTGTERRRTAVVAEEAAVEASNAWDAASSAVKQIITEYAVGSSETVPPSSGWSTSTPTRTPGSYIWMRSTITYGDDTTSTLSPVLVTGNDGSEGPQGIPGAPGEPGEDGAPGATTYTWIRYADTSAGGGISNDPTGKAYIGFAYNKTTPVESNTPGDYTWSLIKGPQGDQGVPGAPGDDGTTTYTWIKYADVASGSGMYDTPTASTKYIGIAVNKTTPTESTTPGDYTWSQFRGNDGSNGSDGADGADGVSVSSVTQYYQTTASTASAPAAPTVLNPPSPPWYATEPAYTAGTALWSVVRVVYSNGTFAYSAVSKVSAFTAAVLADGKLTVATANPTTAQGTGKPVGALWMVKISGELTRMYEWNGSAWSLTPLAETIIPKVAIGEGTYGDLVGRTLTGNLIRTAASGARVQLDSEGLRTFNAANEVTSRLHTDDLGMAIEGSEGEVIVSGQLGSSVFAQMRKDRNTDQLYGNAGLSTSTSFDGHLNPYTQGSSAFVRAGAEADQVRADLSVWRRKDGPDKGAALSVSGAPLIISARTGGGLPLRVELDSPVDYMGDLDWSTIDSVTGGRPKIATLGSGVTNNIEAYYTGMQARVYGNVLYISGSLRRSSWPADQVCFTLEPAYRPAVAIVQYGYAGGHNFVYYDPGNGQVKLAVPGTGAVLTFGLTFPL